ncbi:MAG: IclR family transcriptional regulator [Haloplanus sp.]
MTPGPPVKNKIKTADNVFAVVETLRELDGATVTQLATELELAKSTTHRYLVTLLERGYANKDGDEYRLSLRFLDLGIYCRNEVQGTDEAKETLQQLAEETTEIAWFSVEERGHQVDVMKAEGRRAITVGTWLGKPKPMHCMAGGKAILAHLPEGRRAEILDRHGLPEYTEHTITDRGELDDELDEIRETGVALHDQEHNIGVRSVAAPVIVDDDVLGAVAVSGPAGRMTGERFRQELPDRVRSAANEVELRLMSSKV